MIKSDKYDVCVVGGGPAGMMAAISAAEAGAKVILIEKNKELGKKLLLTGNGRCNLTNAEFNLKKLTENYGLNGKFLFHAFSEFGPAETIEFFKSIGVKTKVEENNRVFPVSEKALDVLNALKKCLAKNNVEVVASAAVAKVISKKNAIEKIMIGNEAVTADKYVFCTGGKSYPQTGSTGEGLDLIAKIGHKISDLAPALVPIKIKEHWIKDLQGLALKNVKIRVKQNNAVRFQETGDILFTHFGISGPAGLNVSKSIGESMKKGDVKISIDLFPNLNLEELNDKIKNAIDENPKKAFKNILSELIPQRLVPIIFGSANLSVDATAANIAKDKRGLIAKILKNIEMTPIGLLGFDSAMATSGGVSLKEIDDKTMKSKIVSNLYFCGEMIDIDGRTGGFNLQACWSTGRLAGRNAAQ
ncbi:MAG: NAD(P)/FAD-dependent oxidoreductase [Parcubacteria group bacterium]